MYLGEVIQNAWWLFIIIFNLKSIFQHFTHYLHSRLRGKAGRSGDSNSRTDPRGIHAWTQEHFRRRRATFEQTWYNPQELICNPSFGQWYSLGTARLIKRIQQEKYVKWNNFLNFFAIYNFSIKKNGLVINFLWIVSVFILIGLAKGVFFNIFFV